MIPEPIPYIPCYMVTPAMEVIDLTWMCGNSPRRSPQPTLKTERELFVEQMAKEFNEIYCSDTLMPMADAAEHVSAHVVEKDYPVNIYLEITTRARQIRNDNCLFEESAPQPED